MAAHIGFVLPHRLDAVPKHVVVAYGRPLVDRPAQVHVQPPEILDLQGVRACVRAARRGECRAEMSARTVCVMPRLYVFSSYDLFATFLK